MTQGYSCKHFSIGLPNDAVDQSLTALFQHVANTLAEDDPIAMDDLIAIGFETLGDDAIYRGTFTIVFADENPTPTDPDLASLRRASEHEGGGPHA